MPYIVQARREAIKQSFAEGRFDVETPGEFNYVLTRLCCQYLNKHGKAYSTLAEVVSALECAKLEFYRRAAAPYEDGKRIVNGDAYDVVLL